MPVPPTADIGVFGGSGFYSFLESSTEHSLDTPYGPPSAPVTIAEVAGRRVAFLPRHGRDHEFPPHRINYRANVWAMKELGVRALFGPCASGSLQPDIAPAHFVIVDQFVDRTWGRADTFYEGGPPNHATMADPYDAGLRRVCLDACAAEGVVAHDGGTAVVVQGPRFSTRAESHWFREAGWHVINMTQYPEAALANEAGIPYAALALITDYDAGVAHDPDVEPVTQEQVFTFFEKNVDTVRRVLVRAIEAVAVAQ